MNNDTAMQILTDVGKIIKDTHVVYSSGRHGNTFINKDALYVHVQKISQLCKMMAGDYDPNQIDVVIGPTMGGAILAQWMAFHMNANRTSGETLPAFAEKRGEGDSKRFIIKRGYDSFIAGKTVVVVDDLLTTGTSARKVVKCVREHKGNILSMSVICNRGNVKDKDIGDVPIKALTDVNLVSWSEEECPLCKDNIPVNMQLGKGKHFFEKRGLAVLDPNKGRSRRAKS